MELKFVANRSPEKTSPVILRRQKLVRRIDQQIKLVRDMIDGQVRQSAWVWMDQEGIYFVPLKYGRHPIELKKGMYSVRCSDLDECEQVLSTFRAMTIAGEFDDHLTKAAAKITERFRSQNSSD